MGSTNSTYRTLGVIVVALHALGCAVDSEPAGAADVAQGTLECSLTPAGDCEPGCAPMRGVIYDQEAACLTATEVVFGCYDETQGTGTAVTCSVTPGGVLYVYEHYPRATEGDGVSGCGAALRDAVVSADFCPTNPPLACDQQTAPCADGCQALRVRPVDLKNQCLEHEEPRGCVDGTPGEPTACWAQGDTRVPTSSVFLSPSSARDWAALGWQACDPAEFENLPACQSVE